MTNLFRWLPSVEAVLSHPALKKFNAVDHARRAEIVRLAIENMRRRIVQEPQAVTAAYPDEGALHTEVLEQAAAALAQLAAEQNKPNLRHVVNGTGIVLHTNLGRAPLASGAVAAVNRVISGYCNLEINLEDGNRSSNRFANVRNLLRRLTGAEDCLVVNNNAAAVLLALNTFGYDREGVISRGQLVEIGGSFRVPEIMEKSGVRLHEIGTTNKTKISDYAKAINEETGVLLVVHPSNFHMTGFVETPALAEVAALGRQHDITTIYDWGCGALYPLAELGVGSESTVDELLASGVDIITFSGDKLLGGPQCGIVLGSGEKIRQMYDNPLTRALRPDKMILAALEGTLRYYLDPESALKNIPTLRGLTRSDKELAAAAADLAEKLRQAQPDWQITVAKQRSLVGGGSLPDVTLPTHVVEITAPDIGLNSLAKAMRNAEVPVVGYISGGAYCLDARTLQAEDIALIVSAAAGITV